MLMASEGRLVVQTLLPTLNKVSFYYYDYCSTPYIPTCREGTIAEFLASTHVKREL